MYLKSLEIHGFKSFADKTKLEFGPGITCIVGPNGSGKSNVCDAIRWVLGEQSIKTLRGTRLEDVIFNGSEGRRPLGMADVTLLFDNSSGLLPLAFNEVTVSRRVYRSGESEFLINKVPCRLKDIQELFNDTGLGKEAFAIIGQGQIDAILSSRPEERRALFEEAAGIIRYRNRKLEATRKLESTNTNLERLEDLLYELEQTLSPLEEEAKKAKLYEELSEELRALEISLSCLNLERISSQQQKAMEKEKQLQNSLWEKESQHAQLTTQWEEAQLARQKLEEQERLNQQERFRLQTELNKNESEKALSQERMATILEREKAIQEERNTNSVKLAELELGYGQEQEQLEELISMNAPQEKALSEREKQLEIAQKEFLLCQEQGHELRNRLFDVEQKLISMSNSQLELQFELKGLKQQEERLKKDSIKYQQQKSQLLQKLEVTAAELAKKKESLELSGQRGIEMLEQKQLLEENLLALREQREELHQALYAARSRIKVLEEMKDSLEGYHVGVRNLFKNLVSKGELNVLGVVGELLKVPPQYEKAIEIALGGAVQYVVAETDQDAKKAIDWLKGAKAGRATFLPLNTLQPRQMAKKFQPLLGEAGVLGLASELVQVTPRQEVIVDYLLGNILVVTDLTVGMSLAKKSLFSFKIVTLDGDVIFPGGSLTGGSQQGKGTGLLGRNREINEQRYLLKGLETKKQELETKLSCYEQERQLLEEEEQKLREKMSRLEAEIKSQTAERVRLRQELSIEQKKMESGHWEEEQLHFEQRKLQQQLEQMAAERVQQERNKQELLKAIEQHKVEEGKLQEKIRAREKFLMEQQVQFASQREKQKALEAALSYYQQNRQETLSFEERLQQELSQLVQRKKSVEDALAGLEKERAQVIVAYEQVEAAQGKLEREKMDLLIVLRSMEKQVAQLTKELKELREQYHQVEMQKARNEVELENALSRLQEMFQLTWEEAKGYQLPLSSRRETEERVKDLRKEVALLGVVNPNATEEYKRLQERCQFLTRQQQDLLDAREGLYRVIREMEKIMSQRFQETFHAVGTAFREVFAYLFEGGNASLELTSSDNILESGIEIIAQPPGKKMQNLSLLSGGERALTATALLFALLKVKPSPFCVLDEIEANLDEVNVDRFARYLREFVTKTQFILVSHRQGTMEVADALYGVTMEKSGVSRLVSVKLAPVQEVS